VGGIVLATDKLATHTIGAGPVPAPHPADTPRDKASVFAVDFDRGRATDSLPFLTAMSRMGVTFSVFLAVLVGTSFPFLHTMTLKVVDSMAGFLVLCLFLVSTVGVRIARRIANRLLDGAKS